MSVFARLLMWKNIWVRLLLLSKSKSYLIVRSLRILPSVVCLRGRFVVLVLLMKNAQKRICIFSINLLIPMIVVL